MIAWRDEDTGAGPGPIRQRFLQKEHGLHGRLRRVEYIA
jgi:hypothetical protein